MYLYVFGSALAQGVAAGEMPPINAQMLHHNIDGAYMFTVDDSTVRPGTGTLRALVHYTLDPLHYEYTLTTDGQSTLVRDELISSLTMVDAAGGYTLGLVRFGVNVPLLLVGTDDGGRAAYGLGELSLDAKLQLADHNQKRFGVAVDGRLLVSSNTTPFALGSDTGAGWETSLIVDRDYEKLFLAGNVGFRRNQRAEVTVTDSSGAADSFTWGDQLHLRLGGAWRFTPKYGVSAELWGWQGVSTLDLPATRGAELLLGGWYRPKAKALVLRAGIGASPATGIGVAPFRALVSAGYEPQEVRDADGDGIRDRLDSCPLDPEDGDGYLDTDGCPEPVSVTVLVRGPAGPVTEAQLKVGGKSQTINQAFEVPFGRYFTEVQAAGFEPAELALEVKDGPPITQEVVLVPFAHLVVKVTDPAGQPVAAKLTLRRGAAPPAISAGPAFDQRLQGGDYGLLVEVPGFKPVRRPLTLAPGEHQVLEIKLEAERAVLDAEKKRIEIRESVYFETGKAAIKPESFALLDDVAAILVDHPEITRVRVEGHTDSRGNGPANLKLSKARAASVRDYLIQKGVATDRLESEGYGEGKPLVPGENEAAWTQNPRVDFFIVGGGGPGPTPPPGSPPPPGERPIPRPGSK